jgi:hypothetical protein
MNNAVAMLTVTSMLVLGSSLSAQQASPIFDGRSLAGWTTVDGQPVTKGWEVVDGMIHLNTKNGRGGNIVTAREYRDFELRFDWKTEAGGNSGIKYRVQKYGGRTLGLEYQIIDDNGYRSKLPATGLTASLYDLYEPGPARILNPPGQFNSSRIVVQGNRIEHWLNGSLVVQACVGSDEWFRRMAKSKFADIPSFGQNRSGKIMLTDHNSEVWYRNLQLTEPAPVTCTLAATRARCLRPRLRRLLHRRR